MKNKNILGLVLLLVSLFGCESNWSQNRSQAPYNNEFNFTYENVAPSQFGGPWKRVWNLVGADISDVAVDELSNKTGDNWVEVARTNREGVFVQSDTTRAAKFRFDGVLESEWMSPLKDELVTSLSNDISEIKGWRCVVPEGTTLTIQGGRVEFNCHEVIIAGTIQAFDQSDNSGRSAGSLSISAESISVSGNIRLVGARGISGQNGTDGHRGGGRDDGGTSGYPCSNGTSGGAGGNGGNILMEASKKITIASESLLSVIGGSGGGGGRAGHPGDRGRCYDGAAGTTGAEGMIRKNISGRNTSIH